MKETIPSNNMNLITYKSITSRAKFLKGAIESIEMFDSLGNCAAAAIFDRGILDGNRVFELCLWEFNSAVHKSVKSDLETAKARYNAFFYRKQAEGFDCQESQPATRNIV